MTQNMMTGRIKFDRPIDSKKHYISLGGFAVSLKAFEEPIGFDFESYEGGIDTEDPTILNFVLRGLDIAAFPDSKYLLTHLDDIEAFKEFFIYLGEEGEEEEIIPLYVKELGISFNAGANKRDFSTSFCERIPLSFDVETPKN